MNVSSLSFITITLIVILLTSVDGFASEKRCLNLYEKISAKHSNVLANTPHNTPDFYRKMHQLENELFKALEECKRDPLLFTVMVENQVALDNIQLAHMYASHAYKQRPEVWQTNHALGSTLCMLKNYEQGIPYLVRAVEIAPLRPALVFNLCSTHVEAGHYKQAIKSCTKLLEMKQHELHGPAYLIRSNAYRALGEKENADRDLGHAKRLGFSEKSINSNSQ